jgi:hypothetical protein
VFLRSAARPTPRLSAASPPQLAAAAALAAPIAFEARYLLVIGACLRLRRSTRGRWALAAAWGAISVALAALAVRHFAAMSWPLSSRQPAVLVAAGILLVFAQALKAVGWGRLFVASERPTAVSLAAGNGGAALVGVLLPGRFDDAMRVAVVRRFRSCPAGVRVLCLSLVMLGLIDSAALAPLAVAGAALGHTSSAVRAGLAVVAAAGVAAAALLVVLPRLADSRRSLWHRLGRWLSPRTTSVRRAAQAWVFVSACWLIRAVAFFIALGALGIGYSLPLALLFLCAGAAAAALPVGLAGAATQIGAGGAALVAAGVGTAPAVQAALSIGVLGVLTGTAVFVAAITWRGARSLLGNHRQE